MRGGGLIGLWFGRSRVSGFASDFLWLFESSSRDLREIFEDGMCWDDRDNCISIQLHFLCF